MKPGLAKVYYDKAKELYPNIKSKRQLINIAKAVKITMNSFYGNYGRNKSIKI